MKRVLLILSFLLFVLSSYSQIESRVLREVAVNHISLFGDGQSVKKEIKTISQNDSLLAYVVGLEPKGFVVLTPTKKLPPVLAYSFENDFVFDDSPENTLLFMIKNDMYHQLDLIENDESKSLKKFYSQNQKKWKAESISSREFVKLYGPILPDIWGQVNCKDEDSTTYINVTNFYTPNNYAGGCVALSLSQILHYYRWPLHGKGQHTNYDSQGSSQGTYYANFGDTYYDWNNMLNEYMYKHSDTIERKAVGKLIYQTGTALDMDYEYDGSTSNINRTPAVLDNYFRSTGHYQTKSWSSFWDRFDENIENSHPLQIAISNSNGNGHAPVCDGYGVLDDNPDINERYYHLNMNWWGSSNAWYRLRGSFNAGGYTILDAAVFDILPDPEFEPMDVQTSNIFTIQWNIADNLVCDSFQVQKDIGGIWTTIGTTALQEFTDTVDQCGNYTYQVRPKIDGHWYSYNYSDPITVFVEGDITSLEFDGDDSYFVNEDSDLLDVDGSDWTIETWVYPTLVPASGTFPAIFSRKYSFEMYFRNTSGNLGVGFIAFDGSGTGFDIEGSFNSGVNALDLNEWHHIAVSRSSGTTKMFFDGIEVGSSIDADFDLDASISALNIGARYKDGAYERYINDCRLDEIRYSRIARYTINFTPHHYDQNFTDGDDILLMHLDEGIGYDVTDASNNFQGIKLRSSPNSPNWVCDANYRAYYVDATNGDDTNPGTEAFPWQTISKVNGTTFEPGDHIKFKRGKSWNEFLYFDETKQGTGYAPIVIEPYGTGNKPVINHSDQGAILTGCSHIVVKEFNISSDVGIMIKDDSGSNPSDGIKIIGNIIDDINGNGTKAVGIYLSDGANNCLIDNNIVTNHNTGIWGGEDSNSYELGCNNIFSNNDVHDNTYNGFAFDRTDCTVGTESIIKNNRVYNNGYHGIELSGRYYIVENNIFHDNGQDNTGGASGIHTYSRASDEDVTQDRGGDHNTIRYNTIYGTKDDVGARTDGNGIQMDMWCDSNTIYNNVVYDNDGAGIILYGASGNKVYNNTMYGNGQDLGVRFGQFEMTILAAELSGANGNGLLHSENNSVVNNIGMAVGVESTRFAVSICDQSISDGNTFSNDLWYNSSENNHFGLVNLSSHTTTAKTLAEWNAYSWTNNEIANDPIFEDAINNNFTLEHLSPAIDVGVDLSAEGVIDDFSKKRRPLLGDYDLGALEHGVYWKGDFTSTWSNRLNWNSKVVPDLNKCVTIFPDYNNIPIIFSDHSVKKLFLRETSKLILMQGNKLDIINQ